MYSSNHGHIHCGHIHQNLVMLVLHLPYLANTGNDHLWNRNWCIKRNFSLINIMIIICTMYLLSTIKAWNPFLTISSLVWNTTNIWFPGMAILVSFIWPVNFATILEWSLPPLCILRKSLPSSSFSKRDNINAQKINLK